MSYTHFYIKRSFLLTAERPVNVMNVDDKYSKCVYGWMYATHAIWKKYYEKHVVIFYSLKNVG